MSPASPPVDVGAGAPVDEEPGAPTFRSLGAWRELMRVIGVSGPRTLAASRRYRSASHEIFRRLPVLR